MATKNHNIRFNMDKPDDVQAWELLHSERVGQMFKSHNSFVVAAILDYYNRCIAVANDPYLETREKEDGFADRISAMVEQKVLSNIPALAGMYLMQQQAIMTAGLQGGATPFVPVMPQMNQPVQMQTSVQQEYQKVSEQKNDDGFDEMDIEENELADVDMF
nr:hypothetical protein [uncultured Anaerosporobacter sp.]